MSKLVKKRKSFHGPTKDYPRFSCSADYCFEIKALFQPDESGEAKYDLKNHPTTKVIYAENPWMEFFSEKQLDNNLKKVLLDLNLSQEMGGEFKCIFIIL